MSLKLKIGYSQIMRFIFYFFRFLVSKNWGKILFGMCVLFSLGLFLNTPGYITSSDKIEFEKSENNKTYYFIKKNDIYQSVLLDSDHVKRGNYIDFTEINGNKVLTGLLFLCLLLGQFFYILENGGIHFRDAQRFAIVNISKFEVDDDGIYNCVVFGRTYYKLIPGFLIGENFLYRVSAYLSFKYAPTLWEIRHCDRFRNRSIDRNSKLSIIGI